MVKQIKTIILLFVSLWLILPSLLHAENKMHIHLEDGFISADIKAMPLKNVLQHIEEASGLWFRGDEALLEQKISARFEKRPLKEGLRSLLFLLNHAMVYNTEGGLEGVFIVGISQEGLGAQMDLGEKPADASMEGQIPPDRDSPRHPGYFSRKPAMPDDGDEKARVSSPPKMPEQEDEDYEQIGPGYEDPPDDCPGDGEDSSAGPDTEPPKIKTPPM